MEEIIVIRAANPDGSVFKTVVDALKDKRTKVVHVPAPVFSVLRIGELEIHHEHRRVLVPAGKYGSTMESMPCLPAWPVHQGKCSQRHNSMRRLGERSICLGPTSVENIIWRLRKKLEGDSKHLAYIKTVVGAGYKIEIACGKSGKED